MKVLKFDKQELGNLEYSLQREMLSTNRAGGYMSTTIVCCNTRKYHGLMVCPLEELGGGDYVLLSSLDETVIQHGQAFNLAIHRFPGIYEPRGHKYIVDFKYTPTPTITYRVGGVLLQKELLWIHSSQQLLVRYTLLEATSQTWLRLRPFLAFRNRHELSKTNMHADPHSYPVQGGVRSRLYGGFPWLYMQTGKNAPFIAAPDWHHDFQYLEEEKRGYPDKEDLLTTGYFEMELAKGESVVFSASTEQADHNLLGELYEAEISRRSEKTTFLEGLEHSARQFLVYRNDRVSLIEGYPWYDSRSRATFIALPGITLTQGLTAKCREILDYHVKRLNGGIFGTHLATDTQLWFFHTLTCLAEEIGDEEIWKLYGPSMKEILGAYRSGTAGGAIRMEENNLIWAFAPAHSMTWMNVTVDGQPYESRPGFAVEANALWYNAVCYTLTLAGIYGEREFVEKWADMPDKIKKSFTEVFWLEEEKYLADYVYEGRRNEFIRPNQMLACSLEYSPLSETQKGQVVRCVRDNLLTPRGIRTLSPRNPIYKGRYPGDRRRRDMALYQGTAFPWLLEHYVRAVFKLDGQSFADKAEELFDAFGEDLLSYGIGSVPELYDGDPPHNPGGAISYAPSVGALLMINKLIKKYKNE